MSASYDCKQRWRVKAKQWLVRYAGGRCQACGYDRLLANLVFHHTGDKDIAVCELVKNTAGWNKILREADKCVLVCHICHGEIHAGMISCPAINAEERKKNLKEIYDERPVPKTHKFHYCVCGARINDTTKYCSVECVHKSQEKVEWPENLGELVRKSSKRAVARSLGVSDRAVAKRLKSHRSLVA